MTTASPVPWKLLQHLFWCTAPDVANGHLVSRQTAGALCGIPLPDGSGWTALFNGQRMAEDGQCKSCRSQL